MAKVYIVTEEEMLSLIDQLKIEAMEAKNHKPAECATPQEMHRAFHYIVVRWAQAMGFSAVRGIG